MSPDFPALEDIISPLGQTEAGEVEAFQRETEETRTDALDLGTNHLTLGQL